VPWDGLLVGHRDRVAGAGRLGGDRSRINCAGSSQPATVPPAGTSQISGTSSTKTIPCNNGYLSVSGVTNTITVTGHCVSLIVSGSGNHVTIDSTDAVSASGIGNVVT
jgi:hypothetical protein